MLRTSRTGLRDVLSLALGLLIGVATAGCPAQGIGDPCIPEAIPPGGFDSREVYLETSAVQCRTRTCMVFRLRGDPSCVPSRDNTCDQPRCRAPDGTETCIEETASIGMVNSPNRVFCTCRCSAAGEANTPLCKCTEGYHCVELVMGGGSGAQGGYCVPNDLCVKDEDCPSRRCNLPTGTCEPPTGT
jgi:hypothetical protein